MKGWKILSLFSECFPRVRRREAFKLDYLLRFYTHIITQFDHYILWLVSVSTKCPRTLHYFYLHLLTVSYIGDLSAGVAAVCKGNASLNETMLDREWKYQPLVPGPHFWLFPPWEPSVGLLPRGCGTCTGGMSWIYTSV